MTQKNKGAMTRLRKNKAEERPALREAMVKERGAQPKVPYMRETGS